jgi:hypothetical protein
MKKYTTEYTYTGIQRFEGRIGLNPFMWMGYNEEAVRS